MVDRSVPRLAGRAAPLLVAAGLLLGFAAVAPAAPTNGACAACHSRPDRATPQVDPERMGQSAHAGLACVDCHVDIGILPHPARVDPVDCRPCHPAAALSYGQSAHGQRQAEGAAVAPGCTGCHGTHDTPTATDRGRIVARCGHCHGEVAAAYRQSIHGQAMAQGVAEAPGCADCHREHGVAAPGSASSSVASRNVARTCASCHDEERIAAKFGLPPRRYATYLDSYHGVVSRYGTTAVTHCASCHGVHDIRPSSDPSSSIHPANLGRTCGACHPGLDAAKLAGARVHVEATRESSRGMFYVRRFYTWFIGSLMVCFALYMGIEVYGTLRRRRNR